MAEPDTPIPFGGLNKRDILPRFGDRVFMKPEEPTQKEFINLQPGLTQELLLPDDFAAQYNEIQYEDGIEGSGDNIRLKPILVWLINQDPENPFSLVICKQIARERGQDYDRFRVNVLQGDYTKEPHENIVAQLKTSEYHIGDFKFQDRGDYFDLHHRFVDPKYRGPQNQNGESIGNVLLTVCKQAVAKFMETDPSITSKPIRVNTGKLDVMIWLYNNGYRPRTTEDATRFQRVLNGDPDLFIVKDFFIVEEKRPERKPHVAYDSAKLFQIDFEKPIVAAQSVDPAVNPDAQSEEAHVRVTDEAAIQRIRKTLQD